MTTPTATTILPTRNEGWGFFGTMQMTGRDAATAWSLATRMIAEATKSSPEGVRDFLDSRFGRHFADEVENRMVRSHDLEAAIRGAVEIHQRWTIDRITQREHGIPAGLPFLAGWVTHFEILDEMAAEADA